MKGFIRLIFLGVATMVITSCASAPVEDDLLLEEPDTAKEAPSAAAENAGDDFSEFEDAPAEEPTQTAEAEKPVSPEAPAAQDQDLSIEEEISQAEGSAPAEPAPETPAPEVAEEKTAEAPVETPQPETPPTEDIFAEPSVVDAPKPETPAPEPMVTETAPEFAPPETQDIAQPEAPAPEVPAEPEVAATNITDLKFKANESGGTVIIQGDQPLNYTTRSNPDLRQFIIEVDNANLPNRLKRSLNTRDIKGSVGAIDAYQNPASKTARFVIQLREGVAEPVVQSEGNSLLIVASGAVPTPESGDGESKVAQEESTEIQTESGEKILPSRDLAEFLAGNTKFYGNKISIETNNMDIRDALNLITEESGMNMVVTDDVKGTVSLKLRQVPWDQALVVLMQAKKLGYTRRGNVLRIAPLQDLKTEEDDATKMAQARKNIEPLKVRMFQVSYARVDELEKKIKDFLGERGKVVGDVRMNALVVTDIEENLDRAAKLIANLDVQPPQVLIEGKIVEAKESFSRTIGLNWGATGAPIKMGSTARGPVNMNPSFSINPTANAPGSNLNFNLSVGTLDFFGTLQAALSLKESEEQVKVISSPRIMTMTNEKADITQTTEVAVKSVTQIGSAGATDSFSFKPLTMKLEVTPQVTADGSVIMKVSVSRQFQGADTSGAGGGAFSVNSREANTRVLVKNGETAVIGGIYQSDATDGETGVPWFRELPFISYLFKTKNLNKEKSELLIFLTPRIVGQLSTTEASPAKDF